MIRALFRRGRHHVRAVKRGPDGAPLVTVAAVAEQIRREARQRAWAVGAVSVTTVPDVAGFRSAVREAIGALA